MGQEQIPIFYKGTTLSNYKEACHVLSCNNCVLMDDLFLRKGNIYAAVSNKFNEGMEIADIDDEQEEESRLDFFDSANATDRFVNWYIQIVTYENRVYKLILLNLYIVFFYTCLVQMPSMMFFHHLKITMIYQGFRIIS